MTDFDPGMFADSYRSGRSRFIDACDRLSGPAVIERQSFPHPLPGPDGQELFSDVVFAATRPDPDAVLVVMSATHGVEGFAGSAVQADLLALLPTLLAQQPGLGVILIHAVNPWGFAWLRRCDHQGIDVNRNCIDFASVPGSSSDFDALYHTVSALDWRDPNAIQALWQNQSINDFVELFAHGHYLGDQCPFFGGHAPGWSRQLLETVASHSWIGKARNIAVVDVHTGLGPYGYGELINDHVPGTAGFDLACNWYGANATSALKGESCSGVKSGLVDYLWHDVMGDRGSFVTLEFGTYPVTDLLTSLLQEQAYYNDCARNGQARSLDHEAVQALRKFFYPEERSWQQQLLFRGRQVVDLAVAGMTQDSRS